MALRWGSRNYEIVPDELNYFRLEPRPAEKDLLKYYGEKYFQNEEGNYSASYSELDMSAMEVDFALREHQVNISLPRKVVEFLDVGCGEGWDLSRWDSKGANVTGLDASDFGLRTHNPKLLSRLTVGPVGESLENLIQDRSSFDLIYLGNVLEHFSDPSEILTKCVSLLNERGIIQVRVPNDFSSLQQALVNTGRTPENFWVVVPDHVSYFTQNSLQKFSEYHGLVQIESFASFPIDWFLSNAKSQYVGNSENGREAFRATVFLEGLILKANSIDKAYAFHSSLAQIGHGRDITSTFRKKSDV